MLCFLSESVDGRRGSVHKVKSLLIETLHSSTEITHCLSDTSLELGTDQTKSVHLSWGILVAQTQ